jgi:hypothetical protein
MLKMTSRCVLSHVNASTYWEYASAFTFLAALPEAILSMTQEVKEE